MTIFLQGVPYILNQGSVALVDETPWDVQKDVDIIDCQIATTLVLPAEPEPGRTYRILASGGDVALDGNGHGIALGVTSIPDGESAAITFSVAGAQWLVAAGGAITGGNPAAPIGSFQINEDGANFGAAGWSFLLPNTVYSRLDSLRMTFHDSIASADFVQFEAGNNGAGDATNPPGTTANYGTDQSFTPSAQVPNSFYWGSNLSAIGVGAGFDAVYAFNDASRFTSGAAAGCKGALVYSNLAILPIGSFPKPNTFGNGGLGSFFLARAAVVPADFNSAIDVAGDVFTVSPTTNLLYALTTDNRRVPTFAQPSLLTFGALDTPTTPGRTFLFPGYAAATITGATEIAIPLPTCDYNSALRVLSLAVSASVAGAGSGTITYTVRKNGVDTTTIATGSVTSTSVLTSAVSFLCAPGDKISIAVDIAGTVTGAPQGIVAVLAVNPDGHPDT